jgi:hypothetical protein
MVRVKIEALMRDIIFIATCVLLCGCTINEHCQIIEGKADFDLSGPAQELIKNKEVKHRLESYPDDAKWKICVASDDTASIVSIGPYGPYTECRLEHIESRHEISCNPLK